MPSDRPFAIIQRSHLDDTGDEDQVAAPNPRRCWSRRACRRLLWHVAYIDVVVSADLRTARKAADETARDFRSGTDEVKGWDQRPCGRTRHKALEPRNRRLEHRVEQRLDISSFWQPP